MLRIGNQNECAGSTCFHAKAGIAVNLPSKSGHGVLGGKTDLDSKSIERIFQ